MRHALYSIGLSALSTQTGSSSSVGLPAWCRPQPCEPQFPHLQTWWLRGSLLVECSTITGYRIITGPRISHQQVQKFICSNPLMCLPTDTQIRWGQNSAGEDTASQRRQGLPKVNSELVTQSRLLGKALPTQTAQTYTQPSQVREQRWLPPL